MERMVTDNPKCNEENLYNYAFASEDKRVKLRYADGEEDIDLCEYIAKVAECGITEDSVMDGGCFECDCVNAYLYICAVQAAELRERLREYEETGLTPKEINRIVDSYGRGLTLRSECSERLTIIRDIETDRLRELVKEERG